MTTPFSILSKLFHGTFQGAFATYMNFCFTLMFRTYIGPFSFFTILYAILTGTTFTFIFVVWWRCYKDFQSLKNPPLEG